MDSFLVDFITELDASSGVEECWEVFTKVVKGVGFEKAVYGVIDIEAEKPTPLSLRTGYNGWEIHYKNNEYWKYDPLVENALNSLDVIFYDAERFLLDDRLSREAKMVIRGGMESGVHHAISVPLRCTGRYSHGVVSVATDKGEEAFNLICKKYAAVIHTAILYTHMQIQVFLAQKDEIKTTSPSQKAVALLLSQGFSYKQIAAKTNLSYDGVTYHIRELKNKLKLRNSKEVALKVLTSRLI